MAWLTASGPTHTRSKRRTAPRGGRVPLLFGAALWGCAHSVHTVEPYRDAADAAQELADRARSSCVQRTRQLPPRTFVTDGCSAFADDGWVECCVDHDVTYWCGGSAEARRQADRRLEQCVAELGHPVLGILMYLGVRAGGPAWFPLPWRWGFGWDFPYDGDHRGHTATQPDAEGVSAAAPPK